MARPVATRQPILIGRYAGKYLYLLLTLVAVFFAYPIWAEDPGRLTAADLLAPAILLAGVYAVRHSKVHMLVGLVLALPALAANVAAYAAHLRQPQNEIIYWFLYCLFLAAFVLYLIVLVLYDVVTSSDVTVDTVIGGLCVYLLLGWLWSLLFAAIELVHPGAFQYAASADGVLPDRTGWVYLVYYSYATLTTVGYGDIGPVLPFAQSMSVLEAVVGQLYLTVLVARLVGLHLSQAILAQGELS